MRKDCLEGVKVRVGDYGKEGVVISNYSPNHVKERYYVLFPTGKVELVDRDDFKIIMPVEKHTPHRLYNSIGYKPLAMSEIAERDELSFDISFCSYKDCDNLSCRRNINRLEGSPSYMRFSVSNFKDVDGYCPTRFS